MIFEDPLSIIEAQAPGQQNPMMGFLNAGSEMDKLTGPWGVTLEKGQLTADVSLASRSSGGNPLVLNLTQAQIDQDDRATTGINQITMVMAGSLVAKDVEGITSTTLLNTTDQAGLLETFSAMGGQQQVMNSLKPSGKKVLGVRLIADGAFNRGPLLQQEVEVGLGAVADQRLRKRRGLAHQVPVEPRESEVRVHALEGGLGRSFWGGLDGATGSAQ